MALADQTDHDGGVAPVMHLGVSRTLGIEIIEGTWTAEAVVTLDEIQERFGISRTVAREVVRHLESLRLVQSRRRVGVVVQPRTEWDVLDPTLIDWRLHSTDRWAQLRSLTALRNVVDPAAAAGAAVHASVEVKSLLPPLAAKMREAGESGRLEEFLALDIRFHRALLTSSGNELFSAVADMVEVILTGRTELGLMPEHPEPEALAAHDTVARAVWEGDAATARSAMAAITGEVQTAFARELDQAENP